MRPITPGACAVALATLAVAMPAASQTGNCFVESSAAVLHGALLGAGSAREARLRTEQLGFTWTDPGTGEDGALGLVHLQRGSFRWALETGGQYATLNTRVLMPRIFGRLYAAGHGPSGTDPEGSDPHSSQPNHATGVVGVIGLLGNFENGIANVELQTPFRGDRNPIRFGKAFAIDDLGARACEARVPSGGIVRLMSAVSEKAPCSAWRTDGVGRWIGIVLESDDMAATAAFFDSRHTPYTRADRDSPVLWLDPEQTGGLLIEFVPRGWRPRA